MNNKNKDFLEQNMNAQLIYRGTTFKLNELSHLGGFYAVALETTKYITKGDSQYMSLATVKRLLKK